VFYRFTACLVASLCAGCAVRFDTPTDLPRDARTGFAPADFDPSRACQHWEGSFDDAPEARVHHAFAESSPAACFVPVTYKGEVPTVGSIPERCGFATGDLIDELETRAAIYELAAGSGATVRPLELACDVDPGVKRAAALQNAKTLRSAAAAFRAEPKRYPYALTGTFGYGAGEQDASVLIGWMPEDACRSMDDNETARLTINVSRARRAAAAYHAGVAPFVSLSGGAVHSTLNESLMLMHLVTCQFGVPGDRVLVDPCADHTHTNVRNTGAIVIGIGGRTAYLVTDDSLQSDYLQEWTLFDLIGGSIDQRALRDWGHLIGAWRKASREMKAGFWYTPYRFWAEPIDGLGSFACVGDIKTPAAIETP
jgi:hypothetical protein